MSSPARVLAMLDLFTQQRPIWHTDEINEALGYSRATGYRYVKDLVEAGFLQKVSAGYYALGARIIELDYQLRQSDPVLLAAAPVMDALARCSGLDVVLSTMFGLNQVVDTHRATAEGSLLQLQYGRGRPRPLFRGAAPKLLMASLPRASLVKLHEQYQGEIAAAGLGESWSTFRIRMAEIRQQGFYLSLGELDEGVGAAAQLVLNTDDEAVAALALVGTLQALQVAGEDQLRQWLSLAAHDIQTRLAARSG